MTLKHCECSLLSIEEPVKEFTLPPSATKTSIRDLTPDVDYVVTIISYSGSEESIPISGQITSKWQAIVFSWVCHVGGSHWKWIYVCSWFIWKNILYTYIYIFSWLEMVSWDCNLYKIVKYPYTVIRNDCRRHGNSLAKRNPFNGRNSFSSIFIDFFVSVLVQSSGFEGGTRKPQVSDAVSKYTPLGSFHCYAIVAFYWEFPY